MMKMKMKMIHCLRGIVDRRRCLALSPAGTILRDPHHRESTTRREILNLESSYLDKWKIKNDKLNAGVSLFFYSNQKDFNIIHFCCSTRTAMNYHWYAMSGKNCSTQGFHVLWKSKYKDISLIKAPSGDSKFETN